MTAAARSLGEHIAKLDPDELTELFAAAAQGLSTRTDVPRSFRARVRAAARAMQYYTVRYLPHGEEPAPGERVETLRGHHGAHAGLAVRR